MHCSVLVMCRPDAHCPNGTGYRDETEECIKGAIEAAERVLGEYDFNNEVFDYFSGDARDTEWLKTAILRKEGADVQACRASHFFEFSAEAQPFMVFQDAYNGVLYDARNYDSGDWDNLVDDLISKAVEDDKHPMKHSVWFVVIDAHI